MVNYYLNFLEKIKKFVKKNIQIIAEQTSRNNKIEDSQKVFDLLNNADSSQNNIGYRYSYDFLLCITLYFYDRFDAHTVTDNLKKEFTSTKPSCPESFIKLFTWAMLPRIRFDRLGFASINKYALGDSLTCGSEINLFNVIASSRTQSSILNLQIPTIDYIDKQEFAKKELRDIVWSINAFNR